MTLIEKTASRWTRRGLFGTAAALVAAGGLGTVAHGRQETGRIVTKGRIKQASTRGCGGRISLDEFCVAIKRMGLVGVDLVGPNDFPMLKKHGLICTLTGSHSLSDGLCEPKFHEAALKAINRAIEAMTQEGWTNVICFSGNARGIDRETGMKNCLKALKEIVPVAEKAGVTLLMELLNSKVNHKDYMCDRSDWGVELCKRVGSDHFKLLYDIYHMQIMEGDIIRTIEQNHQYFGHYHTAGNPGRHELDDTQELNYKAIAKAIGDVGFKGYVAHEFSPTRDPLTSLAQAVAVCDQ